MEQENILKRFLDCEVSESCTPESFISPEKLYENKNVDYIAASLLKIQESGLLKHHESIGFF